MEQTAYFDNAATTFPKPEPVYLATDQFARTMAGSYGRSSGFGAASVLDETRKALQATLQCPAGQVVFTPTATIALNMILQGLIRRGAATVWITPFEHNAVTRVLHAFETDGCIQVCQMPVEPDFTWDIQRIRQAFAAAPPDLVVVSHASNVTGLVAPAQQIFRAAKEYGAVTVLDMAQTAGLVEYQVGSELTDFAVFAGHKTLLGPTGISGFVMKPDFDLPPVLFGGTGFASAQQEMPDSLPERFEMGTIHAAGAAGLLAALQWRASEGPANIREREQQARERLLTILSQYEWIQPIGVLKYRDSVGIVSCLLEGIPSDTAGQILAERGVVVRAGLQCAPLAHQFLGTYPAGTVRFSVGCLTRDKDFQLLEMALEDIQANL